MDDEAVVPSSDSKLFLGASVPEIYTENHKLKLQE